MKTINDYLPENEEARNDVINGPLYERLKDYLEEVHLLEIIFRTDESIQNMLLYATALFDYTHTNYCTNPKNRDHLDVADELAMNSATDYIDEKVFGVHDKIDVSEEIMSKYKNTDPQKWAKLDKKYGQSIAKKYREWIY